MAEGRDAQVPEYAVPPQEQFYIVITVDGEQERRISLSDKSCYILGRNPSLCDIPVEIRAASRVHCCLAHDSDGNVHLVDLNSVHGTQIDGVELGSDQLPLDVVLKPGIPFHLAGDKSMTFQLQPAEALQPLPSRPRRLAHAEADGPYSTASPLSSFLPKLSPLASSPSPSRNSPRGGSPAGEDGELEQGEAGFRRSPGSMEPGERRSPLTDRRHRRGDNPKDGQGTSPRRQQRQRQQAEGDTQGLSPRRRSQEREGWREGEREEEWDGPGRGRRFRGAGEFSERGTLEAGLPGRRDGSPAIGGPPGRDGRRLSPPLRREDRRPFIPDRRPGPPPFDRREGFPPFRGGGGGGRFPPPDRRGMEPLGPRGRPPFRRGSPDYGGPVGGPRGPPPRRGSPDYTDAGPHGRGPPPRRGSPDYTDAGPTGRGQRRPLSPDGADPGPPPRRRRLPSPPMDRGPPRRGPPPPPFGREDRHPPPFPPHRGGPRGGPGEGPRDRPRGPHSRRPSRSPPPYGRERSRRSVSPPRGARRGGPPDRSPPPRLPEQPAPPPQPTVASNPADAAALVRQMMGGGGAAAPGVSGLSVDQKKKLLWGGKKAETQVAPPESRYGSNRWDAAEFGTEQDRMKFIKLMGVRAGDPSAAAMGPQPAPAPSGAGGGAYDPLEAGGGESQAHVIMKRDEQERVLGQLEKDFQSGVRRLGNRTQGLGL